MLTKSQIDNVSLKCAIIQKHVSDMVDSNILFNASKLIDRQGADEPIFKGMVNFEASVDNLLYSIDYDITDIAEAIEVGGFHEDPWALVTDKGDDTDRDALLQIMYDAIDNKGYESVFNALNLDGTKHVENNDPLEFWVPSKRMATLLARHSEEVIDDERTLGIPVWGRTCSGQAISMDQVMLEIWRDEFLPNSPELQAEIKSLYPESQPGWG